MSRDLTVRQREVLQFIREYAAGNGYPPTLREIAARFGISSLTAVRDHLRALEGKGYLRRTAEKSRALVVVRGGRGLPLVGEVAAGSPITAEQNVQELVDLGDYFRGDDTFILRVKGESMIGAGIHPGDLVVVHQRPTLESGEIGVVILGQEATVKRVFFEGRKIRLQPENDRLVPMIVSREDPEVRIAGKVIGVVRKF